MWADGSLPGLRTGTRGTPRSRARGEERVIAGVARRRDELIALSLKIHVNPEIAFEEEKAAAWLGDYLESEGFAVERGICRLATAFRGASGSGEARGGGI